MLTAAPFDRHMPINRGMTYEQMLDAVETQPVHVIEATLDDDTSGLYCEAVQTIIIDEHMTDVQKRCSLTHELFHCCTPMIRMRNTGKAMPNGVCAVKPPCF